jgi:23S rRNA pseudouridine2605 synthase
MNKRTERSPRGDRKTGGPRKAGASRGPKKTFGDRPPRRDEDRSRDSGERGPKKEGTGRGPKKSFDDRPPRREEDRPRDGGSRGPRPSGAGRGPKRSYDDRPPRKDDDRPRDNGPRGPKKDYGDRGPRREGDRTEKPFKIESRSERPSRSYKGKPPGKPRPEKPWKRQSQDERTFKEDDPLTRRPYRKGERSNRFSLPNPANEGLIRLNRYLAQAGVGSRREADELITTGVVTVNGKVVTELGTKVMPTDIIHFGGQKLSAEQKRYILINKPKDTITTTDDPRERHTVMDLVAKACTERLYPVGRLDRNTTGVLLLTNDGDLAKKLTHPSHGAEKIYHVTLDKSVQAAHLKELVDGVHLEDGIAQADEASYVAAAEGRREVGVKLHMGRNRIVRRMFEALGYEVVKLDRVMFAGLTKKDLQRGHWRHLSEKEVTLLGRMPDAPKSSKQERGGKRLRASYGSE